MKTYALRLHPGDDLRLEIENFVNQKNIKAGAILTCVGNLTKAIIRMANAKITKTYEGSFEITSLVGTLEEGNSHIHISISDSEGNTFGGHLKQNSIVGVTCELVIVELENTVFKRVYDENTGYDELVVET